jgi:ferredoxin
VAYVINEPRIGIKDASCVEVCPVDCIHPTPDEPDFDVHEQLYIDPEECIDCDACVEACPVDAITSEDQDCPNGNGSSRSTPPTTAPRRRERRHPVPTHLGDLPARRAVFLAASAVAADWNAAEPFAHGWWLVSFLALVGGIAQLLFGAGTQRFGPRARTRAGVGRRSGPRCSGPPARYSCPSGVWPPHAWPSSPAAFCFSPPSPS